MDEQSERSDEARRAVRADGAAVGSSTDGPVGVVST
jgi:hypothetical protein